MMPEALVRLVEAQLELDRLQLRERGVAADDAANHIAELRHIGDLRRIIEDRLENDDRTARERNDRDEHLPIEDSDRRRSGFPDIREADAERLLELADRGDF